MSSHDVIFSPVVLSGLFFTLASFAPCPVPARGPWAATLAANGEATPAAAAPTAIPAAFRNSRRRRYSDFGVMSENRRSGACRISMRLIIGRSTALPSFTDGRCVVVWAARRRRRRAPKPSMIEAVRSPTERELFPRTISLAVHELRTPVTVVCGYIRMVLKEHGGPLTEKQKKMLLEAERSCERISALVAELSDLGKLESSELSVAHQEIDLSRLVVELASDMHEGE